jgi:hypothetical protein
MLRSSDISAIKNGLNDLMKKSEEIRFQKYEPTLNTINRVYQEIYQFAIDKKLIVYGGWAQNKLITMKNKDDAFYDEYSMADIEFYSPEPIKIGMELAKLLHSKKYQYVQLQEGVHEETYKLFVDFMNFADISYMPKFIYDNLPTIKTKEGMLLTHPTFMTVDAFRMYADPMFSFWRLDKTVTRFTTLLKHYPIDDKTLVGKKLNYQDILDEKIENFIKHRIIHDSDLIVINHYAYNYLIKKTSRTQLICDIPYLSVISVNYTNDVKKITKILQDDYPKRVTFTEYYPFFQFVGRKTEFFIDNKKVLVVYSHNSRCTVYQANFSEKKKTLFGTFSLLRMMLLAEHFNFSIHKNPQEATNFLILLNNLFDARLTFLEDNDKTVMDNTPFSEFTFECSGDAIDPIRQSRLNIIEKVKSGKKVKFMFDPERNKDGKVPEFKFDNTSGNPIQNPKDMSLNQK